MWLIEKDFIGADEAGVCSVDFTEGKMEKAIKLKRWFRFRMKDGDDNVYYEGHCDSNDDESAFDPLDDFGTPNAGCCSIEYLHGKRWEQL